MDKLFDYLERNYSKILLILAVIICALMAQSIMLMRSTIEIVEKTIENTDEAIVALKEMNRQTDSANQATQNFLDENEATSDFDYPLLSEEDREQLEMTLMANCAPSRTASISDDEMPMTCELCDMPDKPKNDIQEKLPSGRFRSESNLAEIKTRYGGPEDPGEEDFPDIESDTPYDDEPDSDGDSQHRTIYYRVQNPDGTWDLDERYDGGPSNGDEEWIDVPYPGLDDDPEDPTIE